MDSVKRLVFILLVAPATSMVSAGPGEAPAQQHGLVLSPDLMELLRAEMRELLKGVQHLAAGIATADWMKVAETSARISASYLLNRKLTPAQKTELAVSLPEHFRRLDANFHHEAEKLQSAAGNHDAQQAAFHYYRLIDTCTVCHTAYAVSRFPGFAPTAEEAHRH
jgi:hypothetical protein